MPGLAVQVLSLPGQWNRCRQCRHAIIEHQDRHCSRCKCYRRKQSAGRRRIEFKDLFDMDRT